MKLLQVALSAASLAAAVVIPQADSKVNYDGYKMFRVQAPEGLNVLETQLSGLTDTISVQPCSHGNHLDVVVPEHELAAFEALNMDAEVVHDDLGAAIAEETFEPYLGPEVAGALPSATWFDAYHTYADHLTWLSDIQAAFPDNSEIFSAGKSYEGRNITGIHLWGSGGKNSKPIIYYHATVHAREWIATMVAEYITYALVSNYTTDATTKTFLENFDFYIITIINPDGFSYSQTNERLWRKNRQPRTGIAAVGTDINRNWPDHWAVAGGASTTPSADDYKGQAACDTPECKVITAFSNEIAANHGIAWYIDFHSYSKVILIPYGYTCTVQVSNLASQQALASGMSAAVKVPYGTAFPAGPICETLYKATGTSVDYLTDTTKVTNAWAIELRGTSFILPANQILPSGIEIWDGIKYVIPKLIAAA
ncbi:hypothetical protein BX600DRAFT_433335 [Xylariales sp. PMI_506]|nr:hypothetical protein BX600DRAFT_433335 [Xylariales sp. PMI_506]